MSVFAFKSNATVYPVICGGSFTTNVTCYIGDTVRFENHANQNTMITLKLMDNTYVFVKPDGTTTSSNVNPPILTPDGNGKLVEYIVQGNEKEYSPANQIGTFTILTNTNVATGITTIGVDEADIRVFPNPVSNELLVRTPVAGTLNIFAANGQVIMATQISAGENRLNIESLMAGIYFVTIGNRSIKILKE